MSPFQRRRLRRVGSLAGGLIAIAACGIAMGADPSSGAPAPSLRLGVLPVENLTSTVPELDRLRESLHAALLAKGIDPAPPAGLDDVLARLRVRFVGGLDHATAAALSELAGVDTFLATSIELYEDSDSPRLAVSVRVLRTDGAEVRAVWADSVHLTGEDAPGAFRLQVVEDVRVLEERAFDHLAAGVAAHLGVPGSLEDASKRVRAERRFRPRSLYVAKPSATPVDAPRRVVVLPFRNLSANPYAGEILALETSNELIREGRFEIVERGMTRKALLDLRLIQEGGISLAQADLLRAMLQADVVVTGTVYEWYDSGPGSPALVEYSAYAVDTASRRVAWLARERAEGNEGFSLFGTREVRTAPAVARRLLRSLLDEIASRAPKVSRAASP